MTTTSDDDYIEETSYVIMDLSADMTEEAILNLAEEHGGIAMTDLMQSPIYCQLGHHTFRGQLDDPVGSFLLFEMEEKQRTEASGLIPMLSSMRTERNQGRSTKWTAKYRFQVNKVMKTEQVALTDKHQVEDNQDEPTVNHSDHDENADFAEYFSR
ncbi:uncharacterized protein BX664DRAFT_332246 [Halteromyces radiatus]|uniref:uncharacterized protein n=1 Tax=Halteromyces radiatus TaxID=101107 RepID=UPI00221F9CC6|nr:uncharacterized protein BX664DRAFT_332246 [Halteromyces radiatus]KAI8089125.1 hypothetical protein BX664DRAFT_332246 [Halteromyces radiatus]